MISNENFIRMISAKDLLFVSQNNLRIINSDTQETNMITIPNKYPKNISFDEHFMFFSSNNLILKYSLSNTTLLLEETISFDHPIQEFTINKNIMIVSLQNNECLLYDTNLEIVNLVLFNNLSVVCLSISKNNKFAIVLSLEKGFERIDLKTYQKNILYAFDVSENLIKWRRRIIKINGNLLIILLENKIIAFDSRFFSQLNTFCVNIEVSKEILNYVNVLMKGQFIIVGTNLGKIFVFNFINNQLFIKYNLGEMISMTSNDDKFFYIDKFFRLTTIKLPIVSIENDDNYYDEKILFFSDKNEEDREIKRRKKDLEIFIRTNNKFILNKKQE